MRTKTFLLPPVAGLFLAIAGCTVGPDYQRPTLVTPAQWSAPLGGGESPRAGTETAWWKTFHDPELDSLIERATKANLDLQAAEARVREARAQRGAVAAENSPQVNANGSIIRQRASANGDEPIPPSIGQPFNVFQGGFDAAWELDAYGGTQRAIEAAEADIGAAEASRRGALVSLLGEVARNYIETRATQRRLAIARENLQSQQDGLKLSTERYQKGLTSELDVQQATTLLAQTQAEVPALESALQISIHHLGILLAQPPGALLTELSQAQPIPTVPPEVPVGLPSDLLLRRPDVQLAERELAGQSARIGVATADLFPKFSLTGTLGQQSLAGGGEFFNAASRFWSIGPSVQWNLFDAGQIRANVHLQTARQEEVLANYEKVALVAFEEVENALVAYANEQVRRGSLEQAAASSRQSQVFATQRYAAGLTNYLEVLDANRSLLQTEDQLAQSDAAVAVNLIALYKALGGGWESQP